MSDEQEVIERTQATEQTVHIENHNRSNFLLAQYKELVAAIRFLSVLPVPGSAQLFRTDSNKPELIIGSLYFPLVGLLLGSFLALGTFAGELVFPPLVLAALLVVINVCLTGGLHLDGLMDTCDGLFGGRTRERKLEIMRDSRVGSFGVLGGVCLLLLKFSLFASITPHLLMLSFVMILPISRWVMVVAMYLFPSARPTGLGASVRAVVTRWHVVLGGCFALLIALVVGHIVGLLVWLLGILVAIVIGVRVTKILGGLTGDIYGAIAELTEVICLLLIVLLHGWF